MSKSKRGLNSKVITVFDPNTDEEFEVYVTYEWYNESDFSEDFFAIYINEIKLILLY